VPESYLESLKTLTTYEYQVFVEGNWDLQERSGSEFYKYFNLDKHVKRIEYNPELPLHISWDENVNPYLPCGIFQIQGTEIRMIDEILGINPRNTVHDVCNEFKYRYNEHKTGLFIYGDATSQKEDVKQQKGYNFFRLIENELMQYQPTLRVARSNPSVVMRANFINKILDKNLYDLNLLISDNCKTAISDFTNTKEAADGTKDKSKERDGKTGVSYQKYGHLSDLTDYLICEAFSDEYSRFQHGDIIVGRSIGRNYISDKHKM
jgi:hypothetical protein